MELSTWKVPSLNKQEPQMPDFKFNISLSELRALVAYAETQGDSPFTSVTVTIKDGKIGNVITVAKDWDGVATDVTNYGIW